MKNLEKLNIETDDMSFEPITSVDIIFKSGAQIELLTPLRINDFLTLWNTKRKSIKIITGKNSFACINKRHVIFYNICPTKK